MVIVICFSIAAAVMFLVIEEHRDTKILAQGRVKMPKHCIKRSFLIHQKITRFNEKDRMLVLGLFNGHLENCKDDKCECLHIAESVNGLKLYLKEKKFKLSQQKELLELES